MLETALSKPVATPGGPVRGHSLLAGLVTELLTTGSATLPSGKVLEASPKDWIETVKWAYAHIDGPPKQEIEQSGGITIRVEYVDQNASTP